jgi:hypothetical protein
MGYGDDIMATGLARGAKARGKRIAFGDGQKLIWGPYSEKVFRYNPNIAQPGTERAKDVEWIHYYKGNRLYNRLDRANNCWIWEKNWKAIPGEMFFDEGEKRFADSVGSDFILFEPTPPLWKGMSVNKDWGLARFQAVADALRAAGHRVAQFRHEKSEPGRFLERVEYIESPTYRHGLAALGRAKLYVGVEGGLHHGAAAVGTKGVVVFGGFVSPQSTGYDMHTNLFSGGVACGKIVPCNHCRTALDAISIEDVLRACSEQLMRRAA